MTRLPSPRRLGLRAGVLAVVVGSAVAAAAPAACLAAASAHGSAPSAPGPVRPGLVPDAGPGEDADGETARRAVAAAEAAAGSVELGVAVLDRAGGGPVTGGRGAEEFYTASLVKVLVAVDVLARRQAGDVTVAPADLELIRRALGPSDDAAMNVLWGRFDGAGAVGRVASRLGLAGTRAPEDPSQWGEAVTTAADTVRLWAHVLDGMPAADRDVLLAALDAAPPVAADGFDQAFGLLAPDLPADATAKQGWMCCFDGVSYLHSAGVVGDGQRYVVALLGRVPRAGGWEASRGELDRIAGAAVQALG